MILSASETDHTRQVTEYFDSIASDWESRYALSGSMRGRLDRFGLPLSTLLPPPARILDFGCGPGDLAAHLSIAGYQLNAIDQSTAMIARAQKRFPATIQFQAIDNLGQRGFRLPFEDHALDAVVASSVLEYVAPVSRYLDEFRRVVKPGSYLLFTVPNPLHPIRMIEWFEIRALRRGLGRMWSQGRLEYLASSINRGSESWWRTQLSEGGWDFIEVTGRREPLILITARSRMS